jgi:ABC-type branched-subunit amino acid transport system permease subunit
MAFSISDSPVTCEAGDACGIVPQNDPHLVEEILKTLNFSPQVIGALDGSILPNLLGQSRQRTGSYTAGFVTYAVLAFLILLRVVSKRWTTTWVGSGGRALREDEKLALAGDLLPAN